MYGFNFDALWENMIRHFINIFLYFCPPSRLFGFRRVLLRLSGIGLANTVSFCGRGWIYGRGKLSIKDGTWISPGVTFYTHDTASIIIGSKCDIGPDVAFIIGSHVVGGIDRRAGDGVANSIIIGDGTWIGARVTVLDGVTIGDGCVIAAGSVVHQDIDDNCLAAGVPAKVKRILSADAL